MSFIARYVYTYVEFVLVTEAPVKQKGTDNKNNILNGKNMNMWYIMEMICQYFQLNAT